MRLSALLSGCLVGSAICLAPVAWAQQAPTPATMAALPLAEVGGRGADVPFTEYEAENAATNGSAVGPARRLRGQSGEGPVRAYG